MVSPGHERLAATGCGGEPLGDGRRRRLHAARSVTPELLEILVRSGMDLNVEWNGKRVLGLVEAQAGRTSEFASTLRRLGVR